MKKAKDLRAVYLEWIDANAIVGWTDITSEDLAIARCKALGFIAKEDKDQIVLCVAYHSDEANACLAIPKSWIKKRKAINVKR